MTAIQAALKKISSGYYDVLKSSETIGIIFADAAEGDPPHTNTMLIVKTKSPLLIDFWTQARIDEGHLSIIRDGMVVGQEGDFESIAVYTGVYILGVNLESPEKDNPVITVSFKHSAQQQKPDSILQRLATIYYMSWPNVSEEVKTCVAECLRKVSKESQYFEDLIDQQRKAVADAQEAIDQMHGPSAGFAVKVKHVFPTREIQCDLEVKPGDITVVCDHTNNSPESIAAGYLNVDLLGKAYCDLCEKYVDSTVVLSGPGPISYGYCPECAATGLYPVNGWATYLWSIWPDISPETKAAVEASLAHAGKTMEYFEALVKEIEDRVLTYVPYHDEPCSDSEDIGL